MRVELVIGLLAFVIAVALAEKTKPKPSNPEVPDPPIADGHIPYDPRHPSAGQPPIPHIPHPGQGEHHGGKASKQRGNKGGHHQKGGMKSHEGAAALKQEIIKIKSSDLPEEEKAARLQALRAHVKGSQMMQSMPPEVRSRHEEFQRALRAIHDDQSLSEEERNQRIADERAIFKADVAALKDQIPPEEIEKMRDERKRTIEGHTAAAMAAKQAGNHKMAREYARRAAMAAKGQPEPHLRKRRAATVKRPSLSEPNFF